MTPVKLLDNLTPLKLFPPRSAAVGKMQGGSADLSFRARHLRPPLGLALCRSQVCQPCAISTLLTKVAREREGEQERKRKRIRAKE